MIIGIDPGPEFIGFVVYDFERKYLENSGTIALDEFLEYIAGDFSELDYRTRVSIEMVENMGKVVGQGVLMTALSVGRIWQEFLHVGVDDSLIYLMRRGEIKVSVAGNRKMKNSDIRSALVARYGDTLKKTEKTYRLKAHEWQAFAAAEALWLKMKEGK